MKTCIRNLNKFGSVAELVGAAVLLAGSNMSAGSFNVTAQIDGESQLVVRRDGLYWHHLQWARPGTWLSGSSHTANYPTLINGYSWYPQWPDNNPDNPADSASLNVATPFLTNDVSLVVESGRGPVTVVQQPASDNDFTLIVDFDDNASGGAFFYDVTVSDVSVIVVPEVQIQLTCVSPVCVSLSFASETNRLYQVQYTATLPTTQWMDLGSPIEGNGTHLVVTDTGLEESSRFYRIHPLP